VLRARTFGDVEPFIADLPAVVPIVAADVVELRSQAGQLRRTGRWSVPRRLVVLAKAGSVLLDMRHAVFGHRVVEIELLAQAEAVSRPAPCRCGTSTGSGGGVGSWLGPPPGFCLASSMDDVIDNSGARLGACRPVPVR